MIEKQDALQQAQTRLAELEKRWEDERRRADEIRALAQKIEARYAEESRQRSDGGRFLEPSRELAAMQAELTSKVSELREIQGETPLLQVFVDSQTIAEVVAVWTGIPVGKMLTDEIKTVLGLRAKLEERVIGQSPALDAISQRIRTSRANLTDPRRPIGVFMLVGPSGVGKTETALALADVLYGGERNLITINMSEYQEPHSVSSLKGSPPGYIGFGEGGF
jgi:type VI secretion system protein VasG